MSRPERWRPVSKSEPCPACQHADWCAWSPRGILKCERSTEPPEGMIRIGLKDNGATFKRAETETRSPARRSRNRSAVTVPVPTVAAVATIDGSLVDLARLADEFVEAMSEQKRSDLAASLGVSQTSLALLSCGWANRSQLKRLKSSGAGWKDDYPDGAFAFPERDGGGKLVGFSFRTMDGRKGAPSGKVGARRGLIAPANLQDMRGHILAVEGASDVAACLSLGIAACGRPSNASGIDDLSVLLKGRDVLVVGERDQKEDGRWPGRDGAVKVASELESLLGASVPWTLPPDDAKDIRAWLIAKVESGTIKLGDQASLDDGRQVLLASLQSASMRPRSGVDLRARVIERSGDKTLVVSIVDAADREITRDTINPSTASARRRLLDLVHAHVPLPDDARGRLDGEIRLLRPPVEEQEVPPSGRDELLALREAEQKKRLEEMPPRVRDRAQAMLRDPHLLTNIGNDIASLGVVGERPLAMTLYLVGTSRLLPKPLSSIIQGTSSSGKSHVQRQVCRLFPEEALYESTDLTPNSLYYMEPGRLIHTWVAAGERQREESDERADGRRALRELQSEHILKKSIPIKQRDGSFITMDLTQHGPIAYSETTTSTDLFDEDANRCLLLSSDETSPQTRNVVLAMAHAAERGGPGAEPEFIAVHHAIQRLLARVRVRIPYATLLAESMPTDRPSARRAMGQILSMIEAIALLHQFQRVQGVPLHGMLIDATIKDYEIARHLLANPIERCLGGSMPGAALRFAERLEAEFGNEPFSSTDALKSDPTINSKGKVNQYLQTLANAGFYECIEDGRGNKPARWKRLAQVPKSGVTWLPDPVRLQRAYLSRCSGQQSGSPLNSCEFVAPSVLGQQGGSTSTAKPTPAESLPNGPAAPLLPQSEWGNKFAARQGSNSLRPHDSADPQSVPVNLAGFVMAVITETPCLINEIVMRAKSLGMSRHACEEYLRQGVEPGGGIMTSQDRSGRRLYQSTLQTSVGELDENADGSPI